MAGQLPHPFAILSPPEFASSSPRIGERFQVESLPRVKPSPLWGGFGRGLCNATAGRYPNHPDRTRGNPPRHAASTHSARLPNRTVRPTRPGA
jgi:hypothetical protein